MALSVTVGEYSTVNEYLEAMKAAGVFISGFRRQWDPITPEGQYTEHCWKRDPINPLAVCSRRGNVIQSQITNTRSEAKVEIFSSVQVGLTDREAMNRYSWGLFPGLGYKPCSLEAFLSLSIRLAKEGGLPSDYHALLCYLVPARYDNWNPVVPQLYLYRGSDNKERLMLDFACVCGDHLSDYSAKVGWVFIQQ